MLDSFTPKEYMILDWFCHGFKSSSNVLFCLLHFIKTHFRNLASTVDTSYIFNFTESHALLNSHNSPINLDDTLWHFFLSWR